MNKLIITGILAATALGGLMAFMPLFEAAAVATIQIDRVNTNRDLTVLTLKATLSDIPDAGVKYKVCVIVNEVELVCDTKPANTP